MHAVDVDEGADGTTVSARYRPGAAPRRRGRRTTGPARGRRRSRAGGVPVARLRGEIDGFNADAIDAELLALAPGPIVVDLSELAFLGSAGLRVLFASGQPLRRGSRSSPGRRAVPAGAGGRRVGSGRVRRRAPQEALEHFALR